MSQTLQEVTFLNAEGKQETAGLMIGRALTSKREKFCQLYAFGEAPVDAYIQAFEKDPTLVSRANLSHETATLLRDPDVIVRIQELRRPIQRKLRQKWEYTLDKALEDCQTAWDLAHGISDPKAMLKCIELRSRLAKLLSDEVNIHHTHTLDKETTDVLLAMKQQIERKRKAPGMTHVVEATSVTDMVPT